ncbi:Uncharacterized protein PBTT_01010 [Plasmodiophora brassicae]|uniref:Uncharacterized protein n=1 Tax=Plasmodiophora brassicae TaxID=37360 RepID=A0A0G4J067_PLABS|nr:hypothetical protein PBRA_001778 [Plasmodiophora brassicae]
MDLAAVLYEDADAFGVEHFFELARTATDLSVDRFDQFHNEFRGQPSITMDVFVQMLTTYLSEQNMIDLMHLATDAHNRSLRFEGLSTEWIDLVESIFDELDVGMQYYLSSSELAILSCAIARGRLADWHDALANAFHLLDAYAKRSRLTRRGLKTLLKRYKATVPGLRDADNALKSLTERWHAAGFGDVSMVQLAISRANPVAKDIPTNRREGLSALLLSELGNRDASSLLSPTAPGYPQALFRLALTVFLQFSQDAGYSIAYRNASDLLADPVLRCISQALINYECLGNEVVTFLAKQFDDASDTTPIDDLVGNAVWIPVETSSSSK